MNIMIIIPHVNLRMTVPVDGLVSSGCENILCTAGYK